MAQAYQIIIGTPMTRICRRAISYGRHPFISGAKKEMFNSEWEQEDAGNQISYSDFKTNVAEFFNKMEFYVDKIHILNHYQGARLWNIHNIRKAHPVDFDEFWARVKITYLTEQVGRGQYTQYLAILMGNECIEWQDEVYAIADDAAMNQFRNDPNVVKFVDHMIMIERNAYPHQYHEDDDLEEETDSEDS